jgi:hypothetical protein
MMQKRERFRLWRKERMLLFRYHFRSFRRRFFSVPQFAFLVSLLGLIAIVLFPGLRSRLRDAQVAPQNSFHISGLVSQETKQGEEFSNQPIRGALIEIGGARAVSGVDGSYDLEFTSTSNAGIPVVFKFGDRESLERIDIPSGSTRLRKDFVFR